MCLYKHTLFRYSIQKPVPTCVSACIQALAMRPLNSVPQQGFMPFVLLLKLLCDSSAIQW